VVSLPLLLLGCAWAGCGDTGGGSITLPRVEAPQELPKLPQGWRPHRDDSVGFAIGLPPGWKLRARGGKVLIRSPDHLVAVTLAVDRNGNALELPAARFATRSLSALPGFRATLRPSAPRPLRGTPLKAVQVTAAGTTKKGKITERATIVVLRRDAIVNYTVAVLENAESPVAAADRAYALKMVRTLRDQPVQTGAAPG
jgi:hypothetical protein